MKPSLNNRDRERAFAVAMGQDPLAPVGTFAVDSEKARPGHRYEMLHTPEGYAVHQGEGCEGEFWRGVLGCHHSKDYSVSTEDIEDMTNSTAVAVNDATQALVPSRIEFTSEQLQTIADTICVDDQGNRAPESFVQLFLGVCRHTGLDPFLRQIYALSIRGKWTAFTGIDGYRVISERTGLDQGMDGPQYSANGRDWDDVPPTSGNAAYCRVGIWRKGVPRAFVAVLAMNQRYNANSNSWKNDPNGMLAKCCETLARRRAFPADMAMLGDTRFDVEDPDGAPMTRAEVPEGSWTELPERVETVEVEHEAPQQAPVDDDGDGASPPVVATPAASSPHVPAGDIPELLNAIASRQGQPAKVAAINVMTRLYDTAAVTKLSADERADFAAILKVRLANEPHPHDGKYTAQLVYVCGICGDELDEPDATEVDEPVAAGLGI